MALDVSRRSLFPEFDNIAEYLTHYAETAPDREAAIVAGQRLSYRELENRVSRCAAGLYAAGIRVGDRVATLSPPHPDYWIVFLASVRIGAIWLGLNPRYQIGELTHVVGDAQPAIIFARTELDGRSYLPDLEILSQVAGDARIVALNDTATFECLADFLDREAALPAAAHAPGGGLPALIVYTSGSTGKPKGAMLTHRGLIVCSRTQNAIWTTPGLRILNNLPINHIGCVGDISCATLVAGGTVAFMERFDPVGSLRLIEQERLTSWGQVPTMFQLSLAAADVAGFDLTSLRSITWEGAAAPRDLVGALRQISPNLGNAYGLTETVGCVTFTPFTDDIDLLADTVGYPVPDFDFRIADADGVPVENGSIGEIQVRGPFVMAGYWRNPEATAAAHCVDGWFRTGDLALARDDGAIRLVGRIREMYKSGGYNVYPREVEAALETLPGIAMAAVIGHDHPLYGEVGHAFVLLDAAAETDEVSIRAQLRTLLTGYKLPKSFTLTHALPMLPVGKIDKVALRAMLEEKGDIRHA